MEQSFPEGQGPDGANEPVEEVTVTVHLSSAYAGRIGPALDQLRELLVDLKPEVSARLATPGWQRTFYGYERRLPEWRGTTDA